MDTVIKLAFTKTTHDPEWLDRYLRFLEESTEPTQDEYQESHHILPVCLFPEFRSFRENPWNCLDLRGSDHLIAHYFLLKALPEIQALRQAFCFMAGIRLEEEAPNIPSDLLQEMAEEYEFQKTGLRWMTKDEVELKVLPHEHDTYLSDGWVFGRSVRHSKITVDAIKQGCRDWHKKESQKPDAYQYLPHGDQHHRRALGCPPEVRARISASLQGQTPSPASVEKRRLKMIGKHWKWSEDSRKAQSERMQGEGNNRRGKPGHWKGQIRDLAIVQKASESLKRFHRENPEARFNKPRGEDHWTYGRPRSEETRAKISAGLTGKVQSEETVRKRSDSMREKCMPVFTPEEEAIFHQFCAAPPEQRIKMRKLIPSSNRAAYALLVGLDIILSGTKEQKPRRYWRTAEAWLAKQQ